MDRWVPWSVAMRAALTGPDGFYRTADPGAHFRTSVHAAPQLVARGIAVLLEHVAGELDDPAGTALGVVDLGAGRGELLTALADLVPASTVLHGVDVAPRPAGMPDRIRWSAEVPSVTGVLVAHEYLDDVPVDVAEVDDDGTVRLVLVEPTTGAERLGPPVTGTDAAWLARWWPVHGQPPGTRAEIGVVRDQAWAAAAGRVQRGLAVAVDYDHERGARPVAGTLVGYRSGRVVRPVPDGSCDITAHVALDACAAAAAATAEITDTRVVRQSVALRTLGLRADRPSLDLARVDPSGYLRSLGAAGALAELVDPSGLGGFGWLVQSVGGSIPDELLVG